LKSLKDGTTATNLDDARVKLIQNARTDYDNAGGAIQSWAPIVLAGGTLICGAGVGLLASTLVE
jgi:hypothetical protein